MTGKICENRRDLCEYISRPRRGRPQPKLAKRAYYHLYMLTARYVQRNVIPLFCDAHAPMMVELQTKPFFRITLLIYVINGTCTCKFVCSVIMERTHTRPKLSAWAGDHGNRVTYMAADQACILMNVLDNIIKI